LNLIGRVNRMNSKRKVSHGFNNDHGRSRLGGRPKSRWQIWVERDFSKCKIKNWKQRSKYRAEWGVSLKEVKARYGP